MREILFRGKRIDNSEWVYGNYAFTDFDNKQYFIFQNKAFEHLVISETVGQYTGLTDKNGKKIFEGDIIQTAPKIKGCKKKLIYKFVIKYGKYTPKEYAREEYSQYETVGFYAFDGKNDFQLSNYSNLYEIIGNIHDNPELLKGGDEE